MTNSNLEHASLLAELAAVPGAQKAYDHMLAREMANLGRKLAPTASRRRMDAAKVTHDLRAKVDMQALYTVMSERVNEEGI